MWKKNQCLSALLDFVNRSGRRKFLSREIDFYWIRIIGVHRISCNRFFIGKRINAESQNSVAPRKYNNFDDFQRKFHDVHEAANCR